MLMRPFDRRRSGFAVVALTASIATVFSASCAGFDDSVVLATPDHDAGPEQPTFTPPSAEAGQEDAEAGAALRCMATECPFPYATCISDQALTPPFKCQNNLLTDSDNCGACGHVCPIYPEFGLLARCSNGKCEPQCDGTRRDCNGVPDDGCEAEILFDSKNCGGCGNVCPEGVQCRAGLCGCPVGKVDCKGQCVDLTSDDYNCGECGNICDPDGGGGPVFPPFPPIIMGGDVTIASDYPPNMRIGCSNSQCKLICNDPYRDCDGEEENGCEVNVKEEIDVAIANPKNCGGCGVECGPKEACHILDDYEVSCRCEGQATFCFLGGSYACIDTDNDPKHCGLCNHACPFVDLRNKHQQATCTKGLCGTECEPNWGDCNGNPADGCETNLTYDGANCGACGNRCNTGAGQPCVDGRCLTEECDAGEPVTR